VLFNFSENGGSGIYGGDAFNSPDYNPSAPVSMPPPLPTILTGTGVMYDYSGWDADVIQALEANAVGTLTSTIGTFDSIGATVVPEPATGALLAGALGLLALRRRRAA